MNMPAVLVEVSVAGIQSLVWVTLLTLGVLGTLPPSIPSFAIFQVLSAVMLAAVAYTLGVLIDRVADSLFQTFENRIRNRRVPRGYPAEPVMRLRVLATENGAATFLNYQRSRIRIARATALNLTLIALVCGGLKLWRPELDVQLLDGVVTELGLLGSVLGLPVALYAWWRINVSYTERMAQAYSVALERVRLERRAKRSRIR